MANRGVLGGPGPVLTGLTAGAVLVAALALLSPTPTPTTDLRPLAAVPAAAAPRTPPVRPTPPPRRTSEPPPVAVPTATTPPPAPTVAPTTAPPPSRPTTTPPPPDIPTPADVDPMSAVLAATNVERAEAGCPPLRPDAQLRAAAQGHAEDMAENTYFSHTSLDGREFVDRIRATGHPAPGGENIAQGPDSAEEVVAGWMGSPGHRRNILDCSFVSLGVGFDGRDDHWVQNFGR